MGYLYRNRDKRLNPQLLVPGAESVVVVGLNYKPAEIERDRPTDGAGEVAHYAWYEDYHDFMKERLYALREFINTLSPGRHRCKVCVDSVPLAETAPMFGTVHAPWGCGPAAGTHAEPFHDWPAGHCWPPCGTHALPLNT